MAWINVPTPSAPPVNHSDLTGRENEDAHSQYKITLSILASETIGQYRLVTFDGHLANSENIGHVALCAGVAMNAASIGGALEVKLFGEIENPLWTFSTGPVFLNGQSLSNVAPLLAPNVFVLCVGVALSATKLFINLKPAIGL